ncbi:histidine utilization repressor [Deltaproteobacteria bacterium Smac51]|nr:histidine utilization repressor [Deltaproteobacteria bacterium Smac51]
MNKASQPENGLSADSGSNMVPRYLQIKRQIVSKINSGQWPSGYRVPSEKELSTVFTVSRMTVNRALRELTLEGLLVRVQGVGTFVSRDKMGAALMAVRNIADEISARPDHRHRTKVILLEKLPATTEVAHQLEIEPNAITFHSVLLHYDNDVPVQIEDRYVNGKIAPDYLNMDFMLETPYVYLSRVAPLTEGEHIVEAVLPTAEEAAWLEVGRGEPCLQMRRRTWSHDLVVTSARLVYPGSRYRLEGRFHN